jgi:hypothetical protein
MNEQNECYAYFCVRGSFDPKQITDRLGVEPTKTFMEGELISKSSMTHKTSLWALYSRLERTSSLEQHINDVLDQLDLNGSRFEALSNELDGVLELVGYFNAYYPGLVFERGLVQRLARYSLSVDFDFYGFADGGEKG